MAENGSLSSARRTTCLAVVRVDPLDRRDVERRGQVVHHRVQQHLHALVLEGRAAEHRGQLDVESGLPDGRLEALLRDLASLEIVHHEMVVALGQRLDQCECAPPRPPRACPRGWGALATPPPCRPRYRYATMRTRSMTPRNRSSLPIGQLDDQRPRVQPVDHGLHAPREVGADAVHLVDEGDARHLVLVGLPPDRLRLRLDPGHRAEQGDGPVEHPQGTLHLHGEVHVPGRVYDVDAMIVPFAGRSRRRDGDAPLLLLGHPVHHRGAVVHLADLVGAARVVEDPLGGGGLAGIDVSHDADVAHHRQRMPLGRLRIGLMCSCLCHVLSSSALDGRACYQR